MQLIIIKGDITTIECDAIISSTNSELIPSGDIDTAIHSVAGPALTKACAKIAHCEVGSCVVTDGYNLPCKYVIHTVAPYAYEDSSAHLLAQCYKNSIKRAVHKGCTSIAFPLIGSGNKGFSTKKALDVAINRLEVCMHSESGDLTIYLVLFDDETKSLAMLRAKELIDEKYLAIGDNGQVDEVLPVDKRWISLCKVNRPDKNKDIWMQRLADSVGGTLVVLSKKEGGEWAINHLPSEYHPLITDAMREYSEGVDVVYHMAIAKRYARYAVTRMKQSVDLSTSGFHDAIQKRRKGEQNQ